MNIERAPDVLKWGKIYRLRCRYIIMFIWYDILYIEMLLGYGSHLHDTFCVVKIEILSVELKMACT